MHKFFERLKQPLISSNGWANILRSSSGSLTIVSSILVSMYAICIISIALLLGFGLHALLLGYPVYFLVSVLESFLLVFSLLYLHYSGNYKIAGYLTVFSFAAFSSYLFLSGGVQGTGHLWAYIYPFMSMTALQRRQGALSCCLLAALWLLCALCAPLLPGLQRYSPVFMVHFSVSFILTAAVTYIVIRQWDITRTDLARSNQELAESEAKYRSLVELANDGIALIKGEKLLYANPQMCQICGFREEEVLGQPLSRFIAPSELDTVMAYFGRHMTEDKKAECYETNLLCKDGSQVPVEINAHPIGYQGTQAYLVIARDITGRKQSQARLLATERLQAAIETAGAACHELNQPLQALMAQAEIAQLQSEKDSGLRQRMDGMMEQIQRMADITGRLSSITDYRTRDYLDRSQILDLDGSTPGQGQDNRKLET